MIISRTPLRISFAGGGSDLAAFYRHEPGAVTSTAINKYIYITVNKKFDDKIRASYSVTEIVDSVDELKHELIREALRLVSLNGGIEITSISDIPSRGTGLGSSSTYLVALLTALHQLQRESVPRQALAEQTCHIEMDLAGHPVGKQDHYLATFGGITCLDIKPDGQVTVRPLSVSVSTVDEFRNSVLLFYTGILRRSGEILEGQKQDTERQITEVLDSLHRTKDLGYRVKEALEQGELDAFGLLLHEHWENKKLRSAKISNPQIDRWYEIARDSGALGGKIMGAGGGGFFMFYCPNSHKPKLREALAAEGLKEMPYDFDFEGAKVLVNF